MVLAVTAPWSPAGPTLFVLFAPGSQSCVVQLAVRAQLPPLCSAGPSSLTQGQPEPSAVPGGCTAWSARSSLPGTGALELRLEGELLYGKGDGEEVEMGQELAFPRGRCAAVEGRGTCCKSAKAVRAACVHTGLRERRGQWGEEPPTAVRWGVPVLSDGTCSTSLCQRGALRVVAVCVVSVA